MAFAAEDLHPRHRLFADEWLTGEHTGKPFNGREAYKYAGYKIDNANPSANASRLLRHPKVAAYIQSRMEEFGFSATEVMLRFADIARANVGEVVRVNPSNNKTLELDPHKVVEKGRFIKSFGVDSNGNPKLEFHDSQRALENMARVLGMFKEGLELSGPGGGAVALKVEFVDADGKGLELGADGEVPEEEDFSDIDRMDEFLDQLD